jgi:hypothetical protein
MKTYRPFVWLFLLIAFVISCQKERSFENGGGPPSHGSLQSGTTGDCLGSTVQGVYKKDSVLGAGNYVDLVIDVTTPGWFVISTDTINNLYFRATGNFSVAGIDTVRLQGSGKPTAASTNVFTVTYDSSSCTFSVTTLPGGGGSSAFTLAGSPGNCVPGTVSGSYNVGAALNAGDSVSIQVNVTTPGTWSLTTTTLGGMTFSGSGTFTTAGVQTIKLIGTGTPTTAGPFNFPVSAGASTCSFTVTVTSLSNDYYPRTTNSNWSYIFNNDATDTLYRNVISATKSAIGNTYNIFMENDGSGVDSSGYFRKSGGDYYQYADIGYIFNLDGPAWGEYIFLKDNVASGTSWTSGNFAGMYTDSTMSPPQTYPVLIRIKETIQQKDVSVVVRGVTYPNTIEVKEEYEYSFNNGTSWTTSDVYSIYDYSRGIGLIKWETFDATGSVLLEELKRHQVF